MKNPKAVAQKAQLQGNQWSEDFVAAATPLSIQ
jgi:hypothetical protein